MSDEPAGVGRDRDPAGRARNARPRDALGRPLARGEAGVEQLPDELHLDPATALATAQELLDQGRPFSAHEVLEAAWKSAPPAERELWRGLAQLAVGLTHAARGNPTGTVSLLRRAAERIRGADPATPERIRGTDPATPERIRGTGPATPERIRGTGPATPERIRGTGPAATERPADGVGDAALSVDAAGLARWAHELADRVERSGLSGIGPADRTPRLRR